MTEYIRLATTIEADDETESDAENARLEDSPEELSDQARDEMIESLCNSKAEEFHLVGYDQVTGKDIWECVSDKYHKTGTPPLHRLVNDILSLKVTQFMNFITMSMYRKSDLR